MYNYFGVAKKGKKPAVHLGTPEFLLILLAENQKFLITQKTAGTVSMLSINQKVELHTQNGVIVQPDNRDIIQLVGLHIR